MTLRERILSVYRRQRPDVVPFMLDLSHWFYWSRGRPWDLSVSYTVPEKELIDYHRSVGAGFYLPNLASIVHGAYGPGVSAETRRDGEEIVWRLRTPRGEISRARRWSAQTYSWHVSRWGVQSPGDLAILAEAFSTMSFRALPERHDAWVKAVGELGVVYAPGGYSAMGHLLSYWMGPEAVVYAAADMPEALRQAVHTMNAAILRNVEALCQLPCEVVFLGDNFSSDLQPPAFFERWSGDFYRQAIRRIHEAGKYAAVHVDGRLRGLLKAFADLGVDCIDAVTPAPMGDLTPAQCRQEAGGDMILSGGVPPILWLPDASEKQFVQSVRDWLELRRQSPRLIAAAGDQVPPGAAESRIVLMRDLVEEHGR